MANSITRTTEGLLGSEDFAGQTDGNTATSTYFTVSHPDEAGGSLWEVATLEGVKCAKSVGSDFDYLPGGDGFYKDLSVSRLYTQCHQYMHAPNSWMTHSFVQAGGTTIHASDLDFSAYWVGGFFYGLIFANGRGFWNNTSTQPDKTWTIKQCSWGEDISAYVIYDVDEVKLVDWRAPKTGRYTWTGGSGNKGWYTQTPGTAYANLLFMSSCFVTIEGLTSGLTVIRKDASDNVVFSERATGTSLTVNIAGMGVCPLNGKWEIIGTDNSQRYIDTTDNDVYGGDTWEYSGDTAGASGGGGLSVINGGIL